MKGTLLIFASLIVLAAAAAAQTTGPTCQPAYEIGTFESPKVEFSPDGAVFFVTDFVDKGSRFIGVYHTKTGRPTSVPGGGVHAWFRGDRWISILGPDHKTRTYDWKAGVEPSLPAGITGMRPYSRYVVLFGDARGARVARAADLATVVQFDGFESAIVDENLGLAAAYQGEKSPKGGKPEVLIWDLKAGKEVARLRAGRVEWLEFLGRYLVVQEPRSGEGKAITVWEPRSGARLGRYEAKIVSWFSRNQPGPVLRSDKGAAVVHMDQPDHLIEIETDRPYSTGWVAKDRIFTQRGDRHLILDRDGRTVLATLTNAKEAVGLDNGLIAVSVEERSGTRVEILDAQTMRPVVSLAGEKIPARGGAADGRFVATQWDSFRGQSPSTLFDTARRTVVCVTPDSTPGESKSFASPDGRHLAVAWSTDELRSGERPGKKNAFKRQKLVVYAAPDPEAERAALADAWRKSRALSAPDRARAQAMFKQAFELFQAGEFDAAVLGFQKGLEIDPANGLAHFYLAETYARQNKTARARQHYQRAIDFAPDSKEALIAQTRLAK